MLDDRPAIVLDNGSGYIKAGFSGASFPSCVVPTDVGRPSTRPLWGEAEGEQACSSSPLCSPDAPSTSSVSPTTGGVAARGEVVCGEAAMALRHAVELSYPIRSGVITDTEDIQRLWDHVFYGKLLFPRDDSGAGRHRGSRGSPAGDLSERGLLLSEAPLFPLAQRARLLDILFEAYRLARVQLVHQGALAVFAAGWTAGVAVECGEGPMHCTPVYDGYPLRSASRCVHVGGRDVTRLLSQQLQRKGLSLAQRERRGAGPSCCGRSPWSDRETVRVIKERFCYAAVDRQLEEQLARETTTLEESFLLPDGTPCTIGQERFEATEVLFRPSLLDVDSAGLSEQLWESIQAADMDLRPELYAHVVLSGGSSLFPGLPTRVRGDMRAFFLQKNLKGERSRLRATRCEVHIEAPSRRRHMVFLGAAALAEVTTSSPQMWVTRAEWEEGGGVGVLQARWGG